MNKQPLVTIITPSFNQAEYLEETILSVLEQDYAPIEYIVVDGGSTDGSVEIIEKYADRLAWWVSEKDNGQSDAINKGMKRAKGEIVAWLNSDDVYRPGAISAAVSALQADPDLGMVYGDLESIDPQGTVFHTIKYHQFDIADLLSMQIIGQPTVFMRKDVLEKAGFLDESYNFLMDHHLWLRMAAQAKMKYVPQTWAAARHHSAAKNTAQGIMFAEEAQRILDWAGDKPQFKDELKNNSGKIRAGHRLFEAYYLLDDGQAWNALGKYLQAFLASPISALRQFRRFGRIILALFGMDRGASSKMDSDRKPLLVTGGHRSGTTWVGKMLAASDKFAYISEPLNRYHRMGVLNTKIPHWYMYICEENEEQFTQPFENTIQLKYNLIHELISLRSPKDIGRMVRDAAIFFRGKISQRAPLLKDPFALFSVPWFIEKHNCDVVIVIRHPAAYVSSLVRLGWFNVIPDLLAQPLLVRDHLLEFQHRLMREIEDEVDPLRRAALFWCVLAERTKAIQEQFPETVVVMRHEDLSIEPVPAFASLYQRLGIPYKYQARERIRRSTSSNNPERLARNKTHSVSLDSQKNIKNWQKLLSEEDIQKVKEITQEYYPLYYSDEDWL